MTNLQEVFGSKTSITKLGQEIPCLCAYDQVLQPVLGIIERIRQELRNLELMTSLSMNANNILSIGIVRRLKDILLYLRKLSGTDEINYIQISASHFADLNGHVFSLSEIKHLNSSWLTSTLTLWRIKKLLKIEELKKNERLNNDSKGIIINFDSEIYKPTSSNTPVHAVRV